MLEWSNRKGIPLGHLFDVVLARFVRFGDVVDDATGSGARLLDHVPNAKELFVWKGRDMKAKSVIVGNLVECYFKQPVAILNCSKFTNDKKQ